MQKNSSFVFLNSPFLIKVLIETIGQFLESGLGINRQYVIVLQTGLKGGATQDKEGEQGKYGRAFHSNGCKEIEDKLFLDALEKVGKTLLNSLNQFEITS